MRRMKDTSYVRTYKLVCVWHSTDDNNDKIFYDPIKFFKKRPVPYVHQLDDTHSSYIHQTIGDFQLDIRTYSKYEGDLIFCTDVCAVEDISPRLYIS